MQFDNNVSHLGKHNDNSLIAQNALDYNMDDVDTAKKKS